MTDKNTTVTIGVAIPLAVKIETAAKEYEGKYVLDNEVYGRALDAYEKLWQTAYENNGDVYTISVKDTEMLKFAAEVPGLDLYKGGLKEFASLLGIIDSIDISSTKNDSAIIEIGVAGLWKAV